MEKRLLHFVVRTPREMVLAVDCASLRVPTHTGQVGLRPRCEPLVLAVEPGLILVATTAGVQYAGTAGGLLNCGGATANLLTPLAVIGNDLEAIQSALDEALSAPSAENEVRYTLGRLEQNILQELIGTEPSLATSRSRKP